MTTVEHGSFTAAAVSLGVSQPAVAEQIQRLERGEDRGTQLVRHLRSRVVDRTAG